jgi:hypothetical protein
LNNIKICHGIWENSGSYTRRKKRYIPMPLKLRRLLQTKQLKFGVDKIEFTYASIPELHVDVVAVVHPKDFFCKKVGYKIVMDRIKWATKEVESGRDINYKSWAYKLE